MKAANQSNSGYRSPLIAVTAEVSSCKLKLQRPLLAPKATASTASARNNSFFEVLFHRFKLT